MSLSSGISWTEMSDIITPPAIEEPLSPKNSRILDSKDHQALRYLDSHLLTSSALHLQPALTGNRDPASLASELRSLESIYTAADGSFWNRQCTTDASCRGAFKPTMWGYCVRPFLLLLRLWSSQNNEIRAPAVSLARRSGEQNRGLRKAYVLAFITTFMYIPCSLIIIRGHTRSNLFVISALSNMCSRLCVIEN